MGLPEQLKKVRIKYKKTQTKFAEFLGISISIYNCYEIGKREPELETIVKIANKLNTSSDYLLGITNNPEPTKYASTELSQELSIVSDNKLLINKIIDILPDKCKKCIMKNKLKG